MAPHAASGNSPLASGCAAGEGGVGVTAGVALGTARFFFVDRKTSSGPSPSERFAVREDADGSVSLADKAGGASKTAAPKNRSKKKLRADLAIDHHPGKRFVVIDYILVYTSEATGSRQGDQVSESSGG